MTYPNPSKQRQISNTFLWIFLVFFLGLTAYMTYPDNPGQGAKKGDVAGATDDGFGTLGDGMSSRVDGAGGLTSNRATGRLTANQVADHRDEEFSLFDDSVTSAAEFRQLREELRAADSQLSTSLTFAALMQTIKDEPDQQKRLQMEDYLTRTVAEYLEKERMNGRDGVGELLGMMGQQTDADLQRLMAQSMAQGATADQVSELLNRWTEAAETGDTKMMQLIGDIMGLCTDAEQARRIGEFIAGNPDALKYFGTGPGQNGSSLGVAPLLEAFSRLEYGSVEAVDLASYVEKVLGTQAIVGLDTVMNTPRDGAQREQAANALAKIGTPEAVNSLAETLKVATDYTEIKTLTEALGNVRNYDSIGLLADQLLATGASISVMNGCASALGNFTAQQLQNALGDRYTAVLPMVNDALNRRNGGENSLSTQLPPVAETR